MGRPRRAGCGGQCRSELASRVGGRQPAEAQGRTSGGVWAPARTAGEELEEPFAVPDSLTPNTEAAKGSTHLPRGRQNPRVGSIQGRCDTQQGIRPSLPTPMDPPDPRSCSQLNHKQFCKQPHSPTPALVWTMSPARTPAPPPPPLLGSFSALGFRDPEGRAGGAELPLLTPLPHPDPGLSEEGWG